MTRFEEGTQQFHLDIAIPDPLFPIAEVVIAQLFLVGEEGHNAILGQTLSLSNVAHMSLVLPVSNSCIIPCLISRVLSRLCSCAAISASMSESTVAMAVCSA